MIIDSVSLAQLETLTALLNDDYVSAADVSLYFKFEKMNAGETISPEGETLILAFFSDNAELLEIKDNSVLLDFAGRYSVVSVNSNNTSEINEYIVNIIEIE